MRTIKFRGKIEGTDEWTYGKLLTVSHKDHPTMIIPENSIDIDCHGEDECYPVFNEYFFVTPSTVGQFTGIQDANGDDIYEGDVVTWVDSDDHGRRDLVKWIDGGLCLCNSRYAVGGYSGKTLVVVGNIHDNPELMEDKT